MSGNISLVNVYHIIVSGSYGLPKPWYFPFTKSYWCYGYSDPDTFSVKQLFGIRKKRKYFLIDDTDQDAGSVTTG